MWAPLDSLLFTQISARNSRFFPRYATKERFAALIEDLMARFAAG
jgi:hypothetical protein